MNRDSKTGHSSHDRGVDASVALQPRPLSIALIFLFVSVISELILRLFLNVPGPIFPFGVSRVLIVFLGLYTVHRFCLIALDAYRPRLKDVVLLASVLVVSDILNWIGKVLSASIATYAEKTNYLSGLTPESLHFAIPYATGGLLLNAVLGLPYSLVFGVSSALVIGIYDPGQPILIPYVLATTFVGCLSLLRFRSRVAYLRAGVYIGLIALPFAMASVFMDSPFYPADVAMRILSAMTGGILCSFIAAGFTPIVEYFGGYVTDMRLIEMATLDHPLLKELSIQAPGTWNHSMVIGMMVESAADAVGANPVLARVGAYFHDIGKLNKPLYFVENQLPGENRHDKLSPSMSALIIRSHVKDGIELAKKHNLPRVIEDMIPEHHGTSLIEYFYDKAVKEAEHIENPAPVDESLYTYPGPKPQTKEAGILMLADGIEAAARTLHEPTLDRIQGLVQKMMNKVFASGQLEECELTLKDLHLIAKCFTRVLNGIYHQRIAYAEPAEKVHEKEHHDEEHQGIAKEVGGGSNGKKHKASAEQGEDKEDNKEDLKRLGL